MQVNPPLVLLVFQNMNRGLKMEFQIFQNKLILITKKNRNFSVAVFFILLKFSA